MVYHQADQLKQHLIQLGDQYTYVLILVWLLTWQDSEQLVKDFYYKNVEQVVGPDHKGEHVFFHLDKQEALPDIISEEVTMMQVAAQVVMNRMGMTILITMMRVPIHMHTTMH